MENNGNEFGQEQEQNVQEQNIQEQNTQEQNIQEQEQNIQELNNQDRDENDAFRYQQNSYGPTYYDYSNKESDEK